MCHSNDGDGRIKKNTTRGRTTERECEREQRMEQMIWEGITFIYFIYARLWNALLRFFTLALTFMCVCGCVVHEFILFHILDPFDQIRTVTAEHGITKPQQRHHFPPFPDRKREREKIGENELKHIVAACCAVAHEQINSTQLTCAHNDDGTNVNSNNRKMAGKQKRTAKGSKRERKHKHRHKYTWRTHTNLEFEKKDNDSITNTKQHTPHIFWQKQTCQTRLTLSLFRQKQQHQVNYHSAVVCRFFPSARLCF